MTLEENMKIALALIEEYSPNNENLTEDEDIRTNIKLLYVPAIQELSQIKKIIKTKTLQKGSNNLPIDCYQVKRILATLNDELIQTDYYMIGKKIIVRSDNTHILEYYAYPEIINEKTEKNYELEIDQDVQLILPYEVANSILVNDPSSNYQAFYNEYQRKIQTLDTRESTPSANIEGGYNI